METIELILRLLAATLAGAFIGYTRERIQKPAGLRTHALISVGSAFLTQLSMGVFFTGEVGDPGRVTAQIVSGIGFLGAGTILKKGFSVKGLTTAATLWVTASVGIGFGAGQYLLASVVTGFVLFIVVIFRRLEFFALSSKKEKIVIATENNRKMVGKISKWLDKMDISIYTLEVESEDDEMSIVLIMSHEDAQKLQDNLSGLTEISGVTSVDLE
ncbi:MAG: MgtC/SapB family protein [Kosmotogaceae bacterium]